MNYNTYFDELSYENYLQSEFDVLRYVLITKIALLNLVK